MKHRNKKPTRAERTPDTAKPVVRCGNPGCDRTGSRYEMKEHRPFCAHSPMVLAARGS